MRWSRLITFALVAGHVLTYGCQDAHWDWWRRHKEKPVAHPEETDNTVDEKLLDEVERDLSARPSASSQPTTGPDARKQWGEARKPPATKPAQSGRRPGESVESPILMVNNEVITIEEVLDPLRMELEKAASELSLRQYRDLLVKQSRNRIYLLINEVLAYAEAKKEITDEMEKAVVKAVDKTEQARITAEFGGRLSRYEAHLAAHGQKRDEVRKRIRRRLIVERYLRDRFLPLVRRPTRDELHRYYQKHPDEFTEPLRVEMSLIDVPYARFLKGTSGKDAEALWPKVRGPERIEARRAADRHMDQARQELASSIPFEAVAKSYSFGPNKSRGGTWGAVSPDGLTGRWAKAAEVLVTLEPGQISDVLRTDDGLLLIKAGKRYDKRVIPFIEAQPAIEEKLVKEQQYQLENELLLKLHRRATMPTQEALSSFLAALYQAAPKHPDDRPDFKLK